ncbi:MAG: polysaccharide biosynthesis C-terminal domain-containing protein [Phycisphaerae bacterium]
MLSKIKQEISQSKTFLQFGLLNALGKSFGIFIPFIIAVFFSPAVLGQYYLTKAVLFFFTTLLLSYIQTPFVVMAGQEREKTGKINKSFTAQLILYIFSLTLFFLIATFAGNIIADFAKISLYELLFAAMAFIGFALKTFICDLFLAADQRLRNALAEFSFGIIVLACVIVFCLIGIINLQTIFLSYFIAGLLVFGTFMAGVNFTLLMPLLFDKKHFWEILTFAKWIFVGGTAAYFLNWGNDNIVLRYNTHVDNIGIYNLGCDIYRGMTMLIFIIYLYYLPFVSSKIKSSSAIANYLQHKRPRIFLLGFTVIFIIFVISPYAFQKAYGGVYDDSVRVLRILLIASGLALYNIFYEVIFNALKKYRFTQTINVLHVLISLILNIILVPIMGITGTAVSAVICYLLRVITYEIYFRAYIKPVLLANLTVII